MHARAIAGGGICAEADTAPGDTRSKRSGQQAGNSGAAEGASEDQGLGGHGSPVGSQDCGAQTGRWNGAVKRGEYLRLDIYRLEVLQKVRRIERNAGQIVHLHAVNEVSNVSLQLLRREG